MKVLGAIKRPRGVLKSMIYAFYKTPNRWFKVVYYPGTTIYPITPRKQDYYFDNYFFARAFILKGVTKKYHPVLRQREIEVALGHFHAAISMCRDLRAIYEQELY